MELTITQQMIKGGSEVLMVRLGKRPLLSFPLHMGGVANTMIDEALKIDENDAADLIALVKKFSELKERHDDADVKPAPAPRKQPEPKPAPSAIVTKPPRPTDVDILAELLDCARQAEIQAHAAAEELERANITFTEAERRADLAWQAFNEALHAALPVGTRILGIKADE